MLIAQHIAISPSAINTYTINLISYEAKDRLVHLQSVLLADPCHTEMISARRPQRTTHNQGKRTGGIEN
jgi:hypothetical protein